MSELSYLQNQLAASNNRKESFFYILALTICFLVEYTLNLSHFCLITKLARELDLDMKD